jgi:glyoxylase-like metal-dependent hydrolase (beta-lactamase superfamily II)
LRTWSFTRLGDIDIYGLADGQVTLPMDYYAGVDWVEHRSMLSVEGTIDRPIGCFLVITNGTKTLIDAGVGPRVLSWAQGGELPGALKAAGIAAESIDRVVCTHAHVDHIGWLMGDRAYPFGEARVALGGIEFDLLIERGSAEARAAMTHLKNRNRLDLLEDGECIAPGLTVRATPGHTRGHLSVIASSTSQRAFILGDVVVCPEEIGVSWINTSDDDPLIAARTRETLWHELEGTDDLAVGAHFPGLTFGVVESKASSRSFVPVSPLDS